MADNALVSMAQQFSGLPMPALIGGPLNAAANANAAMAVTQTKFLLDTCFQKVTDAQTKDVHYTPIMLELKLDRGVIQPQPVDPTTGQVPAPKIETVTTTFNLPMLTIIPINSLGVDNVEVTFEMEVKSSFSEEASQTQETQMKAEASFEAKVGYGPFSVTVRGSASYDHKDSSTHSTHYQKSNSAKYTVNVHAGQLPVPKGVNTIIEAYSKAIQPIEMPTPQSGGPATTT